MAGDVTESKEEAVEVVQALKKSDVIKILKEENPPIEGKDDYSQLMIVVEFKKSEASIGLIKFDYYNGEKLENRGSLMLPLAQSSTQDDVWTRLKEGQSSFFGFTLDSREAKIPEKVIDIINRSFDGAVIQDFIPFARGGNRKGD